MQQLPIIRLQIQESPLKQGDKPYRWYDPTLIRRVDRLVVSDEGAVGRFDDGDPDLVDVHNVGHPASRNHGRASGLSIGFTSHYRAMRELFGPHVTDGIAGENVLADADRQLTAENLAGGSLLTGSGHEVAFEDVRAAEPCIEFSRFVLRVPRGEAGAGMREPLAQLRGGMRGFYVALAEPVELAEGDHVILPDRA